MDTGFGIVTVKRLIRKAGAGDNHLPVQITKLMVVEAVTTKACRFWLYEGLRSSIGRLRTDLFKCLFAAVNRQEFKLGFSDPYCRNGNDQPGPDKPVDSIAQS